MNPRKTNIIPKSIRLFCIQLKRRNENKKVVKKKTYSSPRMREKPIIKPTITSSATNTRRIISKAERTLLSEPEAETSVEVDWF
jgi:hypothetical protein